MRVVLALASVGTNRELLSAHFLIDSGADNTFVPAKAYQASGFAYENFSEFPAAYPVGIGGAVEVRAVPARLLLINDGGQLVQVDAQVEIAKPHPDLDLLPPLLGRDVTDHFRIVIDRQANIVALTESRAGL